MKKKKILYITENYPFAKDGGGAIKSYNTISSLAKKFNILVIYFSSKKNNSVNKKLKIKCKNFYLPQIHWPIKKQIKKLSISYLNLRPYLIFQYFHQRYYLQIQQIIKRFKPDIIHIDHLSMSSYLPKKKEQIWIYEEHNIEQQVYWSLFKYSKNLKRKLFYLTEFFLIKNLENKILFIFDHIFAISDLDKQWLNKKLKLKNITTQNLAVSSKKKKKEKLITNNNLLFIGNLNWQPNYDAITWFINQILPEIVKKIPKIKLNVVGKLPLKLKLPKHSCIVFYGFQTQIKKFLDRASVFILPIKSGGGIRIKALTAVGYHLPIVATSKAMQGLNFRANQDFLLANNVQLFAKQVIKLLKNEQLRKKVTDKATVKLKQYYSKKQNFIFLKKYIKIVKKCNK